MSTNTATLKRQSPHRQSLPNHCKDSAPEIDRP